VYEYKLTVDAYMKLTVRCKSEPIVAASFVKVLPLLSRKIFFKIVGGKARVCRLLIQILIDVAHTRFQHLGSDGFDSRDDRIIASATRRFCKRRTIVFTRACHIAWDRFFSREERVP